MTTRPTLSYNWVNGQAGEHRPAVLLLHGAFGQGRNLAGIARSVAARCPNYRVLTIDVREHGKSLNMPGQPTMAQAAEDIACLAEQLGIEEHIVVGHSLGGKIAGVYASTGPENLLQAWMIDTSPSPSRESGEANAMLQRLDRLPSQFESRQAAIAQLEAEGLSQGVATWMAQNLTNGENGYVWRFNLKRMRALIESFSACDLWPALEKYQHPADLVIIRATQSNVISSEDWERINRIAHRNGLVFAYEVQGGHWLNIDNPQGLVDAIAGQLC